LADLQSVHGFRCYDNTHVCKLIALCTANAYSSEREMSASACTRCMAGLIYCSRNLRAAVVPHDKWSSGSKRAQSTVVSGQRDVSSWSATQQLSNVDSDHV